MTTDQIESLIDEWHVCPYEDNINEFFSSLKICTEAYLSKKEVLDTKNIVSIVKDLRDFLNPHENRNLTHFTDRICDSILIKFKGISKENLTEFSNFLQRCEERVYTKL